MRIERLRHIAFTNWSSTPDEEIAFSVEAIRIEMVKLCAAWGIPQIGVQFYSRDVELPASEAVLLSAVDNDGNPGSGGFHTAVAGIPTAVWEAHLGPWVAAHEALEIAVNPLVDRWEASPDGRLHWREVCDMLQGDSLPVEATLFGKTRTINLCNHARPEWFGLPCMDGRTKPDGSPLYDEMGLCSSPWELRPGGYMETVSPEGRPERIGAARVDKGITTSRTAMLAEMRAAAAAQA